MPEAIQCKILMITILKILPSKCFPLQQLFVHNRLSNVVYELMVDRQQMDNYTAIHFGCSFTRKITLLVTYY